MKGDDVDINTKSMPSICSRWFHTCPSDLIKSLLSIFKHVYIDDIHVCLFFLCKPMMSITCVAFYVGFWIMMKNAQACGIHCTSRIIQLPIDDRTCETNVYTNISASDPRFCSLACVRNNECQATVYNGGHSICKLLPEPCLLLKPLKGYVYQVFQHQCAKWVPKRDDDSGYWTNEYNLKSYIVRRFINNARDVAVGRVTSGFFAIHPNGASVVRGGYDDKLVVDGSCRVTWLPYDAMAGHPIPFGAFIGGFLSATNTPLYVSKINGAIIGYYNPSTHTAWGEYYGIIYDTKFNLMVLETNSFFPWTHSDIYLGPCY